MTRPYAFPYTWRSRSSTFDIQCRREGAHLPGEDRRSRSGSVPVPFSSITTRASAPASWAVMLMWLLSVLPSSPCLTAFSTRGWRQREGQRDRQHLGGYLQGDREAVAEAGSDQHQVVVDGVQFVGEGGEVAVPAERVAREVGEFQEQFAGSVGGCGRTRRSPPARLKMKCGEIWARRALISASMRRVRDWSRSASSNCTETRRGQPRAARTRTADSRRAGDQALPWTRSSTVSGATTAQRREQWAGEVTTRKASPQPVLHAASSSMISVRWCSPRPSQARRQMSWSVRRRACELPSRVRSRRADLRAVSPVRPARSGGAASEAVCRVSKVACLTGVPRPPRFSGRAVRLPSQNPAASSGEHGDAQARQESAHAVTASLDDPLTPWPPRVRRRPRACLLRPVLPAGGTGPDRRRSRSAPVRPWPATPGPW